MTTTHAPHEHGRIRRPSPLSECGSAVTLTAPQLQARLPSWLSPDEQLPQPHLQRTQLLTPGKDACRVCRHGSPPRSHPRDSWSHSPPNSTVELILYLDNSPLA